MLHFSALLLMIKYVNLELELFMFVASYYVAYWSHY